MPRAKEYPLSVVVPGMAAANVKKMLKGVGSQARASGSKLGEAQWESIKNLAIDYFYC